MPPLHIGFQNNTTVSLVSRSHAAYVHLPPEDSSEQTAFISFLLQRRDHGYSAKTSLKTEPEDAGREARECVPYPIGSPPPP